MDDVQRMLIEHACARLVAQYADAVNRIDLDTFTALFTPDAVWQRPGQKPLVGQAAIRAFMQARPSPRVLRHVSSPALIEAIDADHARGASQTVCYEKLTDAPYPIPGSIPSMVVDYRDEYVRTAGGWRIARRDTSVVFAAAK
jgi:ketosteroid isomerase-like protein